MSYGVRGPWVDPARVDELRQLVESGMTFTAIAERMGLTKNVCLGKARRLGLERKDDAPMTVGQERAKKALEARRATGAQPPSTRRNIFPPAGHCIFPVGHPIDSDFRFCGNPVAAYGVPYCDSHMRRCHQKNGGSAE